MERDRIYMVIKGCTQTKRVDYEENFSLLVIFISIRLLLMIIANIHLELYQIDIKTIFLSRSLDNEIYVEQPSGFVPIG